MALISVPNNMASMTVVSKQISNCPARYMSMPMRKADNTVPMKAYAQIAPIFLKNGFTFNENPASNIIGGNNTKKKKLSYF